MDILIIGLGVIRTTYGSVFKEAGHNVAHYIREGSNKKNSCLFRCLQSPCLYHKIALSYRLIKSFVS